jgi:hypothetical protein
MVIFIKIRLKKLQNFNAKKSRKNYQKLNRKQAEKYFLKKIIFSKIKISHHDWKSEQHIGEAYAPN